MPGLLDWLRGRRQLRSPKVKHSWDWGVGRVSGASSPLKKKFCKGEITIYNKCQHGLFFFLSKVWKSNF